MLDIGWSELVVIGVVALIVIGPKDLPEMFRTMGRFTAKMRAMARDFQRAMDDAAKEAGVADVARDLKTATSAKSLGLEAVKSAATKFEQWDPLKGTRPGTAANPATAPAAASSATAPVGTTAAPAAPVASSPLGPDLTGASAAAFVPAVAGAATADAKAADINTADIKAGDVKTGDAKADDALQAAAKMRAAAGGDAAAKPAPKPRKPRATPAAKSAEAAATGDAAAKPARKGRSGQAADTLAKVLIPEDKPARSPGRRRTKKAEDQE